MSPNSTLENLQNIVSSNNHVIGIKPHSRFELFFELLSKEMNSKSDLEDLIEKVMAFEINHSESASASIDNLSSENLLKAKQDYFKAVWKKHLSLFRTQKNYYNNISLNNSNIINHSLEIKKFNKLEKDFNELAVSYNLKSKELKDVIDILKSKEAQIVKLSQVIDDFNQIISQKNKEIKKLKDLIIIERQQADDACKGLKHQLGSALKSLNEKKQKNDNNNYKNELIVISENSNSNEECVNKHLNLIIPYQPSNTEADEPKESMASSFDNTITCSMAYLPNVINTSDVKIEKPSFIPDLDFADINNYNPEFKNVLRHERNNKCAPPNNSVKGNNSSMSKPIKQAKSEYSFINNSLFDFDAQKNQILNQLSQFKPYDIKKHLEKNSRNLISVSHSLSKVTKKSGMTVNHNAQPIHNNSLNKPIQKPNITLTIDLKDISSPEKPVGYTQVNSQISSVLSKANASIPNSKLQSYQKVSEKLKMKSSSLSQNKSREGVCCTNPNTVNTSVNLKNISHIIPSVGNHQSSIMIKKTNYKVIPKKIVSKKS